VPPKPAKLLRTRQVPRKTEPRVVAAAFGQIEDLS